MDCDFPMNNPSWGEYQTSIAMPSSAEAPFAVEIVFDAETTIVRQQDFRTHNNIVCS